MRVAVRHTDEAHPNGGWFAFGEGRILGFTDPISGQSYTPEQVAQALLSRAQTQFPENDGYEHQIQTLHTVEAGGEWHALGTSDLPRVGAGPVATELIEASQGQEASAE